VATDFYVDVNTGSDASAGSLAAPFKTIKKANEIASGFSGDRIIIRKGLYQEPLLESVNIGSPLLAFDEDVNIDGQGTQLKLFNLPSPFTAGMIFLQGIKFTNYTSRPFEDPSTDCIFDNCFFRAASKTGTVAIRASTANSQFVVKLHDCTIVGHGAAFENFSSFGASGKIKNCIIHDNDALGLTLNGAAAVTFTAYPGATAAAGNLDSSTTSPGFVNAAGGNFALTAASALRGVGEKGSNIGATFQPALRVGTGLFNTFAPPGWENDALWWDPALNGGTGGAGTDAIAAGATPGPGLFQGGAWQIDTGTAPTASSARIRSKVYLFPTTVTIKALGWVADEDTTPASGSKLVIDNSLGTAAREIGYRTSTVSFLFGDASPTWNLAAKSTSLNITALYFQARMLMTTVGV